MKWNGTVSEEELTGEHTWVVTRNKQYLLTLEKKRVRKRNELLQSQISKQEQREKLKKQVENLMKQFLPDVDLKIRKKKKPAWSLTKEEAEQAQQEKENKVIQFIDEFDYDRVIQDFEVELFAS